MKVEDYLSRGGEINLSNPKRLIQRSCSGVVK